VQRLVHVADEVRQEHQALRQVIWIGVNGDQSMLRTVLPLGQMKLAHGMVTYMNSLWSLCR
jgi:hypothetical protein